MKHCIKCNLYVNTDALKCPLCSTHLSGDEFDMVMKYPVRGDNKEYRYNFLFRLLILTSIVAGSVSLLVNILTYPEFLWSLIVIGTILFLWIAVAYPLCVRKNIGHFIVIDVIFISIVLFLIEIMTNAKGLGDFVVPFLFMAATLMITFIILIKRMRWREYSVYQIITVVMGFLPIILCVTGIVKILWPSLASALYSFLTFAGMFIFADKKYENELIKRFHL